MSIASPVEASSKTVEIPRLSIDFLKPLASLRLTVFLFAMSIVLILVGTLAQVDQTMWDVLQRYFRCWFTLVPVQVFFPITFFPNFPTLPAWMQFPFPGGYSLGLMLAVNLLAAHATRFRVTATGTDFTLGALLTVIGWGLAIFFIIAGQGDRVQDELLVSPEALWQLLRWSVVGFWALSVIVTLRAETKLDFWIKASGSLILGALAFFLIVYGGHLRLDNSSLRILWQLGQGLVAGIALLVGSNYLFGKRGGIVVIHSGVALLMFGELLVSLMAVEESLFIPEGNTAQFARQTNALELAFIDRSSGEHDEVTVVDVAELTEGRVFQDEALPCDIELVKFLKNVRLREVAEGDQNLATAGIGLKYFPKQVRGSSGASGGDLDMSAAYVRLIPKSGNAPVNTYLLASQLNDATLFMAEERDVTERFASADGVFDVGLRFRRNYKSYTITLNDIRKEDYIGSDTPRDYSSYVTLNDSAKDVVDRDVRIWMNNPLRYSGETFYQTSYSEMNDGTEITTISVVTNTGWMIPYIACMFALVGLVAHFSQTLARFVDRVSRMNPLTTSGGISWALGAAILVFGLLVSTGARPPSNEDGEMDLAAVGNLPVVSQGRQKPLDTVARNALKVISLRQAVRYKDEHDEKHKVSATKWFLDVASDWEEAAEKYPVFRIDNLDVLELLGLERRKRFRYALTEFEEQLPTLREEAVKAEKVRREDASKLTLYQRKILETYNRVWQFEKLRDSYRPVPFPESFTKRQREADPEGAAKRDSDIVRLAMEVPRLNQALIDTNPPLTVPVKGANGDVRWLPYSVAKNEAFIAGLFRDEIEVPALKRWTDILDAYKQNDSAALDAAVTRYRNYLDREEPDEVSLAATEFEGFYNRFAPFSLAMVLYLIGFVATAVGWLGWLQPMRRFAFWLILLTFGLHTLGLIGRVYISGRPPVTDLHSSAIFIGWAGVMFALILETIFKFSLGNAVAGLCGFAALLISDRLALDGDTFTVMQAVLDTQFWLSTHVVCITLGYSATFAAGAFAIVYIFLQLLSRVTDSDVAELSRNLIRIVYGSLCFALLFSFVGTVLGGLWADDSWGRFWGWDPKENGALIIVLWNALILHARWGAMIRERGLACLSVLGNIATAWSWFGVNELQVGLHSYGFTEGALLLLGIFCTAMLTIAAIGFALGITPKQESA